MANLDGIRVIEGDTYSIVAASEAAIVASGTATLETALLGCPMVITYKVSPLTYMLGRMLVTGVSSVGMPTYWRAGQIVPELIQGELTARNLVRAVEPMLHDSIRAATIAKLNIAAPESSGSRRARADMALSLATIE